MKRLIFILLIAAICFAIGTCVMCKKKCIFFLYENYTQKEVEIHGLLKTSMSIDQLINFTHTLKEYAGYAKKEEINETLKESLFQRHIIKLMDDEDFVVEIYNDIKAKTKLYDLGTVNISHQFETHLILSVLLPFEFHWWRPDIKTLYMLNTNQNQLKSIAKIADYHCSANGHSTLLSIQEVKDTKFVLKHEIISSDVIYSDKISRIEKALIKMANAPEYCRFRFDEKGYVVK